MTTHPLSPELLAAYRSTRFCAWIGEEELVLRIGHHEPRLEAIMRQYDVEGGCFVTAWNPLGQALDDASNVAANKRLAVELDRCGWAYFRGEGRGVDPRWPAEASFLVLGPGHYQSAALCTGYEQNAVVTFDDRAIPQLLLGGRVASRDKHFRDARMLVPKFSEQDSVTGRWSITWPKDAATVTAATSLALVAAFATELQARAYGSKATSDDQPFTDVDLLKERVDRLALEKGMQSPEFMEAADELMMRSLARIRNKR